MHLEWFVELLLFHNTLNHFQSELWRIELFFFFFFFFFFLFNLYNFLLHTEMPEIWSLRMTF